MKFRPQHLQRVAAKAGLSERTARRIETIVVPPPKPSLPAPKFDACNVPMRDWIS